MLAIKISIISLVVGIVACQQVVSDDKRPFLRILAPKFICNDKKETTPSNSLTIGLQTREGQKLRYKISVDFAMLDGFKSQKHTLSIWKNIKMLQKKFANISEDISLKNQLDINALELTPQVVYTFKITGFDENNLASETQNFTITFKGGELKAQQSNLGDGVSLLLLGSEFVYDDMELLAVAEVTFCDPINDFSFQWKVVGFDLNEITNISGSLLNLPPGVLKPGLLVDVIVTVLNNESLTMASATLPIKILAKDFQLQIAPSECLVGIGRDIPFQAIISHESMTAEPTAIWTCSRDGTDCSENFANSSMLSQIISFTENGIYELKSEISIYEVTKSATSKVTIDTKVIPHVQLKYFPKQPVDVTKPIEIVVTVLNLVPKCIAFWNVLSGDGLAGFKNGSEENLTNLGLIFIKDFEENFLQELIDYDNNTLSKDVILSIPKEVLLANEKYKFRLTTTCPEPLTDSNSQRGNISSFYDIMFETNAPPELFPLIVAPLNGIPMQQKFKFSTGAAKDSSTDFPLKYTFGYIFNNVTVIIGSFYESMVTHTRLPFADAIETFCEVCDNNGACGRISGPTVAANVSYNYSSEEIEFNLAEFQATLSRAEYSDSLNSAVVFLSMKSQWKAGIEQSSAYESKIFLMMYEELKKTKMTDSLGFVYQQNVIEFVKMSKIVMNLMPVYDETFVEDLLSLTETISRSSRRMKRTILAHDSYAKVVNHGNEYIKNVLSLSEMLLNSNNVTIVQREKGKFISKVHRFIASMCQDTNLNSQFIETKLVSFEVSKVFSPQLYLEEQKIPGGDDSTILFNHNGNFPSKYVCVAKVKFMMDMFSVDTNEHLVPIYETLILENNGDTFKPIKAIEFSDGVTMEIDVLPDTLSMTCMTWNGEKWLTDECFKLKTNSTNQITCKCKTSSVDGVVIKRIGRILNNPVVPGDPDVIHDHDKIAVASSDSTTSFTFLPTPSTMRTLLVSSTIKFSVPDAPLTTIKPSSSSQKSEIVKSSIPETSGTLTTNYINLATPTVTILTEISTQVSTMIEKVTILTSPDLNYNVSSDKLKNVNNSSVSWIVIVLLLLFFALIIILFSIHKCRYFTSTNFNLPMRNPSSGIKYAKYHDEFTLQG